jgi:DNA-binding Lrp family transcriptional regulator
VVRRRRYSSSAQRLRAHPDRGRRGGSGRPCVSELDGVERAEDVTGPYDVVARIQARGLDQLGRLVVARIQAVDGVTRTLTCPVVRL